jgi:hypothetical protein
MFGYLAKPTKSVTQYRALTCLSHKPANPAKSTRHPRAGAVRPSSSLAPWGTHVPCMPQARPCAHMHPSFAAHMRHNNYNRHTRLGMMPCPRGRVPRRQVAAQPASLSAAVEPPKYQNRPAPPANGPMRGGLSTTRRTVPLDKQPNQPTNPHYCVGQTCRSLLRTPLVFFVGDIFYVSLQVAD